MLDFQVQHIADSCWQLVIFNVTSPLICDVPGTVASHVRPAPFLEVWDQLVACKIGDPRDLAIEVCACRRESTGNLPDLHEAPWRSLSRRSARAVIHVSSSVITLLT